MSLCMESLCLEGGGALRLKLNENFNKNCTLLDFWNMESVESVESVGPRCALKIVALRAKIGSVVPTALIFIVALAR